MVLKTFTIIKIKDCLNPNKFKCLATLYNKGNGNKSAPFNAVHCGSAGRSHSVTSHYSLAACISSAALAQVALTQLKP